MKKNQKGFSLIEVLVVCVVAGLIGIAGWYVWQHKTNSKAAYIGDKEKIASFRSKAASIKNNTYGDTLTLKAGDPQYYFLASSSDGTVTYDISADNVVMLADLVRTDSPENSAKVQTYYDKLVSELKNESISDSRESQKPSQGSLPFKQFNFTWGAYQCYLTLTYNAVNTSLTEGVCNPISDYQAANKEMSPYVEAIKAKKPEADIVLSYSGRAPTATTALSGYEWVELGYGQAGGFYLYRKINGDWVYFSSYNDTPTCSDFSADPVAKLAFKGVRCRSGSSTIKL